MSRRELFIKLAKILEHYLFVSGIAKMVVMGGGIYILSMLLEFPVSSSSPSLPWNQYGELSTKRKARWRSRLRFPDAARHEDHLVCSETAVSTLIMQRTLTQHVTVNIQFYSPMP